MKKLTVMLLAVGVMLLMVLAAPVQADGRTSHHRAFGGDQVMALNVDLETNTNLYGCDEISWFGTINLHGRTYGMALYAISSNTGDDGLVHYEEDWRIFTRTFRVKNNQIKDCSPGRTLASGTDTGVWDLTTGNFESTGTVNHARGRLRNWNGKTVNQTGVAPQPVSTAGLNNVPGLIGQLTLTTPHRGDQVMALNVDLETNTNLYGCDEISWFGTINLHGRTYGMALYAISSNTGDDGLVHYEEDWRIFTRTFRVKNNQIKHCNPGRTLASGTDTGTWDLTTGNFESTGTVNHARGRLRNWNGKTVNQTGVAPQPVSTAGLNNVPGLIGQLTLTTPHG